MDILNLETDRLILRNFDKNDVDALYTLLKDEEVNTFLPWFPIKSIGEAQRFYENRFANKKYCVAICLKEDNIPIGYVNVDTSDSYDFGYALCKELWHKGIVTEAGRAMVEQLKNNTSAFMCLSWIVPKYCCRKWIYHDFSNANFCLHPNPDKPEKFIL